MVQKDMTYRVYANWAKFLGCDYSELLVPNVKVLHHSKSLDGYNGIYAFSNEISCIISTPPKYVSVLGKAVMNLRPDAVFDTEWLGQLLNGKHTKIIGPAFQGYVEDDSLLQASSSSVIEYKSEHHRTLLEELRESCSEIEWQHSSIDEQKSPILLQILNGKIVAAGSWRWGESGFLSVGIITQPAHRGKGHAKKVVNALTQRGLTSGATMHYQTLESNIPSVAIAKALGYKRLGRTIAIRLSG
ncbi:GNAT family N-acetyltransferase [Rossellomorea vietnamensis]|uniref:GNAT family N-acetyltransferase n=1 Tax=Rossellomorea vietnamensis TaxID=218284 RepID=UPI001E5A99FF|nr:GNAT family N-acetyltransferase [Rossellomorea vietnamensis]MCC5801178.1 GNAT family N-acetyltransferase [Rossellomorea vietnamensis]